MMEPHEPHTADIDCPAARKFTPAPHDGHESAEVFPFSCSISPSHPGTFRRFVSLSVVNCAYSPVNSSSASPSSSMLAKPPLASMKSTLTRLSSGGATNGSAPSAARYFTVLTSATVQFAPFSCNLRLGA